MSENCRDGHFSIFRSQDWVHYHDELAIAKKLHEIANFLHSLDFWECCEHDRPHLIVDTYKATSNLSHHMLYGHHAKKYAIVGIRHRELIIASRFHFVHNLLAGI